MEKKSNVTKLRPPVAIMRKRRNQNDESIFKSDLARSETSLQITCLGKNYTRKLTNRRRVFKFVSRGESNSKFLNGPYYTDS